MTALVALGVPLGVLLGVGLWLVASTVPRLRAPGLAERVAPYVRDVSEEARRLTARSPADPGPLVGALWRPLAAGLHAVLARISGGDESAEQRLRQAGSIGTVAALRSRQLPGGAVGALVGAGTAAVIWRTGAAPAIVGAAVIPVLVLVGVLLPDRMLSRAAAARLRRMAEELPTVLEFLTLSLSAGEGAVDALRRVARTGSGELAREIAAVVAACNAGRPLASALADSSRTLALPAWTRCVDQVVTALDRGTPLAEVLRAQAQDARDQASRDLIEAAGRKEVAMLVPLSIEL